MAGRVSLEDRVSAIERRNSSVTLDKAWETSWTRKIGIAALTYLVVLAYLFWISNENPWINAIVPPIGFLLSTLALGWLRQTWQHKQ